MTDAEKIVALEQELDEVKAGYRALDANWDLMHNTAIDRFRNALEMPDATIPEMCVRIGALRAERVEARERLLSALGNDSANTELPLIQLIEMLQLDCDVEYERADEAERRIAMLRKGLSELRQHIEDELGTEQGYE